MALVVDEETVSMLRTDERRELPTANWKVRTLFVGGLIGLVVLGCSLSLQHPNRMESKGIVGLSSGGVDLLTIKSVKCMKPSTGTDPGFGDAFAALGAVIPAIAATAVTVANPAMAPVTVAMWSAAAGAGSALALQSITLLDNKFSGTDHLVMKVNGQQVFPQSGAYRDIQGGQQIDLNLKVSFSGNARVGLLEYDWGSDHDYMGHVDVAGGKTEEFEEAIVFESEESGFYLVTYRVDAGKGDAKDVVGWTICGTNTVCDACRTERCEGHDISNLDRDKDFHDLARCPPNFEHSFYKRYPQWWPAADVYLNVCKRKPLPQPTELSADTEYVKALPGEERCHDGYVPVVSDDDCRKVKAVGDPASGKMVQVSNSAGSPACYGHWPSTGCFIWDRDSSTHISACGAGRPLSTPGHVKICQKLKLDYVELYAGEASCPRGYEPVTSKAECRTITDIGNPYSGETYTARGGWSTACYGHWPSKGCFVYTGTKTKYFSTCGASHDLSTGNHHKICKRVAK